MSNGFGFMIESLVAVLLLLTIGYCIVLNNRLKRLKADEQALKATISELITATEIAERAVAGLKTTAHECDETLGERLRVAERTCVELNRYIKAGDVLVRQLYRIVAAGRPIEGDLNLMSTPELGAQAATVAVPAVPLAPRVAPGAGINLAALEADLTAAPPAAVARAAGAPAASSTLASLPDARAVAVAAQAFAARARERLGALAA